MKKPTEPVFPIFLTCKEAAGLLKCTPSYLIYLVKKKRGPPVYKLGHRFRYKKADVLQWMDNNRIR